MRSVLSCSSATRLWAVSEAATHSSAAPVALPAASFTSVSHCSSTRAIASGSARRQPSCPSSSISAASRSSRSAASTGVSVTVWRALGDRLLVQLEQHRRLLALHPFRDERAQRASPRVSKAAASSVAVRRAAAAGLLSSWASPALSVPSAASFSCWRSADSAACAIGAIRRTAVFIAVGLSRRNCAKHVAHPRRGSGSASARDRWRPSDHRSGCWSRPA